MKYRHVRSVKPWSIQRIEPVDPTRLCEVCEEQPATLTGIEYQATRVDPAEWMDVCDECGGSE